MKGINWKVRFKNKLWLSSFIGLIISFIFSMMTLFDVYPTLTENEVLKIINNILTFLGLTGVLVDPTTAGFFDSERAMTYEEPWEDEVPEPEYEEVEEGVSELKQDEESPNGNG